MNILLTFFLHSIFSTTAPAVIEISGNITDHATGTPIEKVYVYTITGEEETLSDATGRFKIVSWQAKPVKVHFEKKGFKKKSIIYTGNSSNRNITLQPE